MSRELIIALFGFLAPLLAVLASTINLVTALINACRRRSDGGSQQAQPSASRLTSARSRTHAQRSHVALISSMLVSLLALVYVACLPGSGNRWFFRIHLVSVLVAGLSGIAVLVLTSQRRRQASASSKKTWRMSVTIFVSFVFLISFGFLGWHFIKWQGMWPSARLMTAGFDRFESEDYTTAIVVTEECGDDFHGAAKRVEDSRAGKELPTGKIASKQKDEIFNNGVLNDVSACYWIKGRSAQKLHRVDEAKAAYHEVLKYPHARVWDERGFFWNPAEDALDRLKDLQ